MDRRNQQQLRDALFERAGVGAITGEQADAEAVRLGLGPLSRQPDPEQFDPQKETFWTLAMSIAWIAYGTLDAVRDHWNEYRTEFFDWHFRRYRNGPDGEEREGWHLEQRQPASVATFALSAAYSKANDEPMRMPVREAEEALWIALRTDCFRASGLDEVGRRVEIVPLEWIDLALALGRGDREELRRGGLGPIAYTEVLVPSAQIRGLWAVRPPKAALPLPELMRPEGDGYMPLFCAAQWIATRGGQIDFDPEDIEMWRPAFEVLLAALASERVGVIGTNRNGEKEEVPGRHFADCEIDYPYQDPELELIMSNELYLRSYPYDDIDDWRGGFSDALMDRNGVRWIKLMVLKSEVGDRWPFDTVAPSTGAPGRPSSMHLLLAELDRRKANGQLANTLRSEAEALLEWLKEKHPSSPRPTVGGIANGIRQAYRQHRGSTK